MKVKPGIGEQTETVWLIDWENPEANHFVVAEEVTVSGSTPSAPTSCSTSTASRSATIELKRSKVAVSEGIRQTIGNQKPEFIRPFFTTVQLVIAGNDVEGLRYGVIDTPEKYWLAWQRAVRHRGPARPRADAAVLARSGFLELIHDFMVFDAGVKKTCRHNQYFGVKAAQDAHRQARGRHHLAHPGLGQVA